MTANGRRAPVQGDGAWRLHPNHSARRPDDHEPGTISWEEYLEAYVDYSRRFGKGQSAERLAERGGFSYNELVDHLRRPPKTWEPLA